MVSTQQVHLLKWSPPRLGFGSSIIPHLCSRLITSCQKIYTRMIASYTIKMGSIQLKVYRKISISFQRGVETCRCLSILINVSAYTWAAEIKHTTTSSPKSTAPSVNPTQLLTLYIFILSKKYKKRRI